jgi:iron uptake system component EfeO
VSTDSKRIRSCGIAAAVLAAVTLASAACSSSPTPARTSSAAKSSTVSIELTTAGCAPKPATVRAGTVEFDVANDNAGAATEAELRTSDLTHILGEQENLTPGLSGGFSLNLQPGRYAISCPDASQSRWKLTVSGKATGPAWQSNPQLAAAVSGYSGYVAQNAASLVTHTQAFCEAIEAGQMTRAERLYPQARMFYERIEPVAEIWGSLDTEIDGRWENPVTVASQFIGFHKIEQLMWADNTLAGAPKLCGDLVTHEKQLLTLVRHAQYNPLEMASGATDLINEAATSKISGEEERYSNTDLPDFKANVEGAMEVVTLLRPYLTKKDPALLALINRRNDAAAALLARYESHPGYDHTGYVEYSTVLDNQRRQLAAAGNALAEALSQLSVKVS